MNTTQIDHAWCQVSIRIGDKTLNGELGGHMRPHACPEIHTIRSMPFFLSVTNRPFLSSPRSLFESESKHEIFVMVISSNFNMNEN